MVANNLSLCLDSKQTAKQNARNGFIKKRNTKKPLLPNSSLLIINCIAIDHQRNTSLSQPAIFPLVTYVTRMSVK